MIDAIVSASGHSLFDDSMIITAVYLVFVIPLTLITLWLRGSKRAAFTIFITTVVAILFAQILGLAYYHEPPHLQGYETLLENDPENAFPSNHASAIAGFTFGVLYMRRYRLGAIALAAAALIGFARVYTGLHFPVDIAGGTIAGLVGVGIVIAASGIVERGAEVAIEFESRVLGIVLDTD